jgi:hypothetical protein
MPTMIWALCIGALLSAASSLVFPARSVRPRRAARWLGWVKGLAALRSIVSTIVASLAFSTAVETAASAPDAVRWTMTLAAGGCLLAIILNALAGLWLLSPFVGADLGLEVTASGLRGTISGYGWARLEVTTHAGQTAHVPYAWVAARPFIVRREDGPRVVQLTLRRERWDDDELQHLREVAVLSPYRDPSVPVSVSRRERVATVRLALAQGATREGVQRHLERARARVRDSVLSSGDEPHAEPSPVRT